MSKKDKEPRKKPSKKEELKEEQNLNEQIETVEVGTQELGLGDAIVLTEEQRQTLLREEIRKANRTQVDRTEQVVNKRERGVDVKVRKTGSIIATIISLVLTLISFFIMYYVIASGDIGKIILLGLMIVLPLELTATIIAIIVFITNIVFMFTGRFKWMIFINFILSLALIVANILIFVMGSEMFFNFKF